MSVVVIRRRCSGECGIASLCAFRGDAASHERSRTCEDAQWGMRDHVGRRRCGRIRSVAAACRHCVLFHEGGGLRKGVGHVSFFWMEDNSRGEVSLVVQRCGANRASARSGDVEV